MITNTTNSIIRYTFENYNSGQCIVKNQRQSPVLFNSSDYNLAIENFSIYNPLTFSNVSKIIFETSLIPVSQTVLSSDLSITRLQIGEYLLTNNDRSQSFISNNTQNYNWYTMNSQDELSNVDIYCTLQFINGTQQLLNVVAPANNSFTCTVIFKRIN